MDGLVDRRTDSSCQEVTTWLGRTVWEVMDGAEPMGEGRKEGWIDGQTDR